MIDKEFVRGFVKLYALWRASRAEVFGLEILREMNELGFTLSPGTVYPALHKLRSEGDVSVRRAIVNGKVRQCYRLTPKGRRELREVKSRLRVLVERVFS